LTALAASPDGPLTLVQSTPYANRKKLSEQDQPRNSRNENTSTAIRSDKLAVLLQPFIPARPDKHLAHLHPRRFGVRRVEYTAGYRTEQWCDLYDMSFTFSKANSIPNFAMGENSSYCRE
jgi:hypothetical protein